MTGLGGKAFLPSLQGLFQSPRESRSKRSTLARNSSSEIPSARRCSSPGGGRRRNATCGTGRASDSGCAAARTRMSATAAKSSSCCNRCRNFGVSNCNRVANEALSAWMVKRAPDRSATTQCGASSRGNNARTCSVNPCSRWPLWRSWRKGSRERPPPRSNASALRRPKVPFSLRLVDGRVLRGTSPTEEACGFFNSSARGVKRTRLRAPRSPAKAFAAGRE